MSIAAGFVAFFPLQPRVSDCSHITKARCFLTLDSMYQVIPILLATNLGSVECHVLQGLV